MEGGVVEMRRMWTMVVTVAALLALAPVAQAATYTVTGFGDGPGECAELVCPTIRSALTAAANSAGPDIVDLPAGAYTLSAGALTIASEVTLRGFGARSTTITAAPNQRVLEIGAVTARVERLTVTGGTATAAAGFHGGNIRSQGGNVVLDRVRVTAGSAYSGGGVANNNGQMTIQSSLIDGNAALDGGGDGGGIINFGGDGGGAASLTVQNSTIAFNTARLAGGLISRESPQNAVALEGVTIARNTATAIGVGGIMIGANGGTVSARSTIVANNVGVGLPSNCGGGTLTSQGANVESGAECGFAQDSDRHDVDALLGDALTDAGGETDVLLPSPPSPAVNLVSGSCAATDQRGTTRPLGPRCDAGAVELDYEVRIDSGPSGATSATAVEFTFSTTQTGASFECALDRPGGPAGVFGVCSGDGSASYPSLTPGEYTFRVRAIVGSEPIGEAPRAFTVVPGPPETTIVSGPAGPTNDSTPTFTYASDPPGAAFECALDSQEPVACPASGFTPGEPLADGQHTFSVRASGDETPATRTFVVDTVAPQPVAPEPAGGAAFAFAGAAGDTFECRLEGPGVDTGFAACGSPQDYGPLAPGDYAFSLVTIDAAGNRSAAATRTFSVAAPQPQPQPTATPTPSATPAPTPEAGETVVARPTQGKILVKRPGSSTFVELNRTSGIPVGSEVNAKNGRVLLTIEPGNGNRVQRATFYGGIFELSQPGATLDLTLSEELAPCPKKKASTAQSKAKKRKLWGDGKGKFRTKGRHSSATIRGTRWLVEDSCAGTLTKVTQGVVSVRDTRKKKTLLLRAGKQYLARP